MGDQSALTNPVDTAGKAKEESTKQEIKRILFLAFCFKLGVRE